MNPAERLARYLLLGTDRDFILVWELGDVVEIAPSAAADERREIALEAMRWLLENGYVVPGELHQDGSYEQWDMSTDEVVDYVDELWRREDGDLEPYHFPYFKGTESGKKLGQSWHLERPEMVDAEFVNILYASMHERGKDVVRLSDVFEACRSHSPTAPLGELRRAVLYEMRTLVRDDYMRPINRAGYSAPLTDDELDTYVKRLASYLPDDTDGDVRQDVEYQLTDRGRMHAERCWKGRQQR